MNASYQLNNCPEKGKVRVTALFYGHAVGNADFIEGSVDGRQVEDTVDRFVRLAAQRHNLTEDQVAPDWVPVREALRRHFNVTVESLHKPEEHPE